MNLPPFHCAHSIVIRDTSHSRVEYIFDIQSSNLENKLLVSASDHNLLVFDYELNLLQRHPAHNESITAIEFSKANPSVYYSVSTDKSFCLWDSRASGPARLRLDEEINTMAVNPLDNLLVLSQGLEILFYDLRSLPSSSKKPKPLGKYSDVHSDIVTKLRFSPSDANVLLSSGEDGLVALYGLDATEEEQAVLSILNTDCPVGQVGFFGGSSEGVFTLSTIETASLWHFPSAQRISSFPSIRDQFNMDYLVDCIYEASSSQLLMFVGNHEGHSQLLHVNPTSISEFSPVMNCNRSTIRSICCPHQFMTNGIDSFFTGGEDGQLNLIKKGEAPTNQAQNQVSTGGVGSSRVQVMKKDRYSPY